MGKNQRKFKNFFIRPHQQLMLATVSSLSIIVLLLSLLFFELYTNIYNLKAMASVHEVDPDLVEEFTRHMIKSTSFIAFFILSLGFMIFFFMIKITHTFFGPLVPINRLIDELKKGNFGAKSQLRKGDQLMEVMENLNSLSEILKKDYSGEQKNGN
ncbi:MAG: hypothetical protein K2Q26_06165 [Bdellovibrionales bacterium]|nr:hypothetical protein [Bdellovibrionales bacterium]